MIFEALLDNMSNLIRRRHKTEEYNNDLFLG